MKVLQISTECYPAAKAGGMGDVVGALPLYLPSHGVECSVIIPKYKNKWISNQKWEKLHTIDLELGHETYKCHIKKIKKGNLAFDLYTVDIPGLFDRAAIYLDDDGEAFKDEVQRYIAFQRVVLDWLLIENEFELLHCHDHMTGLITFMIKYCPVYEPIKHLPTFFTIHNGQYRGVMDWSWKHLLPSYNEMDGGILDWDGHINGLATAIKCCHWYTTVSPSYLDEIQENSDTLTSLYQKEKHKSSGILNGIDEKMWDPKKDPMIDFHLKSSAANFKKQNRKSISKSYAFSTSNPLISFIGRFAFQKGADLLTQAYDKYLSEKQDLHFFILGSGDKKLEEEVLNLSQKYPKNVTAVIAYDEKLAHRIYAASDFIIMPSRFEPCGLNQMYGMRYGTIPIVRETGGLKDTVPDIGDNGNGISFLRDNSDDIVYSLKRSRALFDQPKEVKKLREKIMKHDFSWHHSASQYAILYHQIISV